uniref:Transposase, MuDR, MULE transposase domain protein n=1 Tax=Tanacetum cinerariifolium TaxID=118510 RepID=A0A699KIJ8_TANCI|nr:transposase, MuDR, MULE transposase domain protein [Tanacetum cinerariifolium]
MRPLIIIDGAYLKGTYEGTNLLAVGMDKNNQIVPIVTGVCQGGESTEAWSFFLSKLKESIGVVQDMTIISDRHPDYTLVYRPKDIQRDLKIDLNIDISYKKARGGRKKAFDMAMGSPAESFAQLPYYCHNLKMANEGTVTHIETDAEGRFKLLYVGFDVAVSM